MKSWAIYILAALGFVGYNMMTDADRDSSGAIVDGGNLDAFAVRVGDCFDDAAMNDTEVTSIPGVPCDQPHDNEAYAVFDVNLESYPGEDGMWEAANERCLEKFEAFVGLDYESSSLDIFALYPSEGSWQQNDREVVCAVYDMDTNKLTGSVKGLAL